MAARTRELLLEHLAEQRYFLTRAARDFDAGSLVEAKLMAVHLRVLLHHTATSHALLVQLGLREKLTWVDTAGPVVENNLAGGSTLTILSMSTDGNGNANAIYEAGLGDTAPRELTTPYGRIVRGFRIHFNKWWNDAVVRDNAGREFTRRSLVLALSNQEGGAHVDPQMKEAYTALARSNSIGWAVSDQYGDRPVDSNPVLPSIRQITYEVLTSFDQQEESPV